MTEDYVFSTKESPYTNRNQLSMLFHVTYVFPEKWRRFFNVLILSPL